ncbi:hypothetical protein BAUCODRAFT_376172 [Baudoinia panamericana UAMH 10762]|uniref:Uncharacterized protein n=1 Tax=Baudoinia panamericana (strain UAMH 10762) TaxID=717646 RepID=M2NHU5_BAUPA|nr:uncharacterized protein BAUCODRAFT_376172 [Baudoinia panamericana UAMH 10762]EMC98630.1 hypothetical protein BAUCODRAFT_376172 [Baudoinia panamericana UAMH 10762]
MVPVFDAYTMASLRKRLSKRHPREDMKFQSADELPAPPLARTPERLSTPPGHNVEAVSIEDFSNTAAIPSPLFSRPESSIRRVSPSEASNNRYKLRSAATMAPSLLRTDSETMMGQEKQTAFSEDLDDNKLPESPAAATSVTTENQAWPRPLLASRRSRSSDNDDAQRLSISSFTRRSTRSQERRLERTDSAASTASASGGDSSVKVHSVSTELTAPGAKPLPRTPSPSNAADGELVVPNSTDTVTTSTSKPTFTRRLSPQNTGTYLRYNQTFSGDESKVFPSPDDVPASHEDGDHLSVSPSKSPAPTGEEAGSHDKFSTLVLPPVYEPLRLPVYQWCSQLGSSSRPDNAWGWSKRWTCCQCRAQTIAEQKSCAQLKCGHRRCGSGCKMIKH